MGLDVYLYRYENFDETTRLQDEYERRSEAECWDFGGREYGQLTEGEKETARTACKALATSLGLDEHGEDTKRKTKIDQKSTKHPEHMFEVGYFRSSYNEGGINRILRTALGEEFCLDWIFRLDHKSPYKVLPNWSDALERAKKLRDDFSAWVKETGGLRVASMDFFAASIRPNEMVGSPEQALTTFLRTRRGARVSPDFSSFSNGEGHYFLGEKPLQVRAVLTGKRESIIAKLHGQQVNEPCAYVVYEDSLEWYQQALDVVVESCEWVLAQAEPEKHYLHWSS